MSRFEEERVAAETWQQTLFMLKQNMKKYQRCHIAGAAGDSCSPVPALVFTRFVFSAPVGGGTGSQQTILHEEQ